MTFHYFVAVFLASSLYFIVFFLASFWGPFFVRRSLNWQSALLWSFLWSTYVLLLPFRIAFWFFFQSGFMEVATIPFAVVFLVEGAREEDVGQHFLFRLARRVEGSRPIGGELSPLGDSSGELT